MEFFFRRINIKVNETYIFLKPNTIFYLIFADIIIIIKIYYLFLLCYKMSILFWEMIDYIFKLYLIILFINQVRFLDVISFYLNLNKINLDKNDIK